MAVTRKFSALGVDRDFIIERIYIAVEVDLKHEVARTARTAEKINEIKNDIAVIINRYFPNQGQPE